VKQLRRTLVRSIDSKFKYYVALKEIGHAHKANFWYNHCAVGLINSPTKQIQSIRSRLLGRINAKACKTSVMQVITNS
jgi:hypothetical protein